MSRERVYNLQRRLRSAITTAGRLKVLSDFDDILPVSQHSQSPAQWHDMMELGLIDLLIELLSQTASVLDNLTTFAQFFATGMSCLQYTANSLMLPDDDALAYLIPRLPPLCRAAATTLKRLRNDSSVPDDVIYTIQYHTARYLGVLLRSDGSYHLVPELIDAESALRIVLAVVYRPPEAGESTDLYTIQCCMTLLATFGPYAQPFVAPAIDHISEKYGYSVLGTRCVELWTTLSTRNEYTTGLTGLVLVLHRAPWLKVRKLYMDGGVYATMIQHFWRWKNTGGDMSTVTGFKDAHGIIFFLGGLFSRFEAVENDSAFIVRVVSSLLKRCDLVPYLGHLTLYYWGRLANKKEELEKKLDLDPWSRWISLACTKDPSLRNSSFLPAWSQVLRSLHCLARCATGVTADHYQDAIQQWEKFNTFDIVSLYFDDDGRRTSAGCDWMKCLLYPLGAEREAGGIADVALLKCGSCRQVQYCGGSCQRRDWKAGHQKSCETLKHQNT